MKNKINKAISILKVVLNIFMWTCGMVFILFLFYDTDSEETAMLIHSTFKYFITFLVIYVWCRMAKKINFSPIYYGFSTKLEMRIQKSRQKNK